jgi:hypothetical protein
MQAQSRKHIFFNISGLYFMYYLHKQLLLLQHFRYPAEPEWNFNVKAKSTVG